MDTSVLIVFALVYLGMIIGEIPGLALDRTGVALLGAIALVALGDVPVSRAWSAVDMPTLFLLFGLMVLSAQLRLGGFYTQLTRRLVAVHLGAPGLLALVVAAAGLLSAVLTNDIVCLAMAPVLIEGCARRRIAPLPFLLALACAANVGSAATLIGNPQNILVGQSLKLSFSRFLLEAGVPALLGLAATWAIIAWQFRGRWEAETSLPKIQAPEFNRWQSAKGLFVAAALMLAFLFLPDLPREAVALSYAGLLLLSRRMASREMLSLVDWQLLVLFAGLFIVNHALQESGAMVMALDALRARGVDPASPGWLFTLSVVLSNVVSNVPATMLLLPSATHSHAGPILALSSTLAGNLFIVGSIANLIVVAQAKALGVVIDYRAHARTGVPVTLATLAIAAGWLWAIG
ncbi:MAG: anion transporter [Deltaproteobacteria bacterium]|nr:anion transporter [Deltaproteobacteria bacterium]